MKIAELVNGYYYMITNEQQSFIVQLREKDLVRSELDERQLRLAEEMHSLGIIDREYNDETETVTYKLCEKH